jgi:hypothetical protein
MLQPYFRLAGALARARSWPEAALKLMPILSKYGMVRMASFLLARSVRPLTTDPGRFRILVIEKAIFNEDILAALRDSAELQVFGVGRAVLKAMAVGLLPRKLCADDTYLSDDPADAEAKRRYRAFWRAVLANLPARARFDAVLTGNWAYWAERELGAALEERGTPFIVMHKEGIKPPARSALLRDLFRATRGQFMGRRMFVYNQDERHHQADGGIARDDQIVVVGMPRMDALHAWRRKAAAGEVPVCADRPTVLFLAFLPDNFLPSYSGLASDLAWSELCRGSLRGLLTLATANPEIEIIVRPRAQELPKLAAILADLAPTLPANLRLSAEGGVAPLLEQAWVVAGHNTTVLLEALALGKPTIVPDFAEARDPAYAGYLVDVGAAAEHADSEDDFVARIRNRCAKRPTIAAEISPAAVVALDRWTGNGDGAACERVRHALMRELEPTSLRT